MLGKEVNATITFTPKVLSETGDRRQKPTEFTLPSEGVEVDPFTAKCLLNKTTFKMVEPIIDSPVDMSTGAIYAGFWRPLGGVILPQWIKDGKDCHITFLAAKNSPAKGMLGIFVFVTGRTNEAREKGWGPDFIVNTRRQN